MRFTSGWISPAPGVQDRTAGSVGLAVDRVAEGVLEGDEPVGAVVEAGGVVVAGGLGAGLLDGF